MSVQINSAEGDRVSITVREEDLSILLSYLTHAKFGDEIKSYVLLSPLINDLIRAIIEFSDRNDIRESGAATWERAIAKEEASDPQCFVFKVLNVLSTEIGESGAKETLLEAIYPNRLEQCE